MPETSKTDHGISENNGVGISANGAPLSRQVTVALTPEQYERLFFQPSAPRRGDLAKKFANPTLLGLIGFLVPYTSTILILCGFQGAVPPQSLVGIGADYYFFGALAMNLAGVAEFILGNTFPMAIFIVYGSHWGSLAYQQDPIHRTTDAFSELGGQYGAAYNASQGFHNVSMVLASFVFLIGTIRVNFLFTLTFFGLVMLFAFIAAADFNLAFNGVEADIEHIDMLLRVAGGFGFLGLISGWYLAILTACEAVGIPCPLPVFDLSSKVFPTNETTVSTSQTIGPDCQNGPLSNNLICDVYASPPERAAALVAAMETQEKLDNLVSKSKGVPRLGLPAYNWWGEALHGVAGAPGINFTEPFSNATSFPMPLLMSAAFDDDLIYQIANVIGNEARAFGNGGVASVDYWTPDINPFRDPRWGRGSETPGEDILRIKGYTKHLLAGLEGNQTQRKIIATCKHYVGYDMEAWGGTNRHRFDAKTTMQDLVEYYMPPFQQCARDSKVGSIMCSYNAVNGIPTCADTYVLQTILREHWNWTGSNNYITSDCEAVADISENHNYTETLAEGTALAFANGMDLSCEYSGSSDIPGAWKQGLLNTSVVNRALTRQYEGLVHAGYFDGTAATYSDLGIEDINTPKAQQLALQIASEGLVMLKNDHTLPLPLSNGSNVAMIGFWANDSSKLSGIYSGPPPYLHTPVWAGERLGLNMSIASGPILQNSSVADNWTTKALNAAQRSDYILYFGGLDTSAAAEGFDRTDISWPSAQVDLITKLSQLGKSLVVIALGDMVDNSPLLSMEGVNSVIWANWPGQDGGSAVMQVVSGAYSVAGRLPITQYPADYTSLSMLDMNLRPDAISPGRTYRWYNESVQPFGFGLHYTSFDAMFSASKGLIYNVQNIISNCTYKYQDLCEVAPIEIAVTNKGNRTSDFVALAFIKGEVGPEPFPLKTLVSYARLRDIDGGVTNMASLPLKLGTLARVDESGNTVIYPGEYTLLLDEPTQAELKLTITGDATVLDKWPQPTTHI
ncbi:glycoside hydrolase family 3 protein [Stemphylium lycopersici]|uniref:xylan 1,4-beta-xylosidase n=1 Tax=Stemphylium lycopersici TaxID=183478 RepID=A0A364MTF0_STELY|nr:glycoside hydrolase family 3 protein [Stemphylium lycopersici]RAR02869.1 glycoside hydrolase family 3 protein [Stemphylium lycopersici]